MLQRLQNPSPTASYQVATTAPFVAPHIQPAAKTRRRRSASRWRTAEDVTRWAAISATTLGAMLTLCAAQFWGPFKSVEVRHHMTLPPSAVILAQWDDPFFQVFQTGERYTVVRLQKRDVPAFLAQVKRKLYPMPGGKWFGFYGDPWRDEPNGSHVYLCKYGTSGDALTVTVEPERAGAVLVDLTTIITD